jgi:hypothetical protein
MIGAIAGGILQGAGNIAGLGGSLLNKNPSPFDFAQRRLIHKKSFIEFHFPSSPTVLVARLPFYENIDIKESRKANIVSYDPIGRNSSLYSYTGASSRKLKLSFALTVLHIQSMHDTSKMRFKPGDDPAATKTQIKELMKAGAKPKTPPVGGGTDPKTKGKRLEKVSSEPLNWVEYVAWWVNLVRSSVLSNQQNTTQGPPVIRLTHGELYQNIPCICHAYNISYDNAAGMDVDSLLSRRILITMDLEEFRAGNFGEFNRESRQILDRDNVAGWEAIIAHSSTDPGDEAIELSKGALDWQLPDEAPGPAGSIPLSVGGGIAGGALGV